MRRDRALLGVRDDTVGFEWCIVCLEDDSAVGARRAGGVDPAVRLDTASTPSGFVTRSLHARIEAPAGLAARPASRDDGRMAHPDGV